MRKQYTTEQKDFIIAQRNNGTSYREITQLFYDKFTEVISLNTMKGIVFNAKQPDTEQLDTEQPNAVQPSTEQPSTEQPSTEQPNAVQPSTEQPSTEQPSTEQPSTEQPSTEQPSTEQPSTEQPSTEQPSTEQPNAVQPSTEQPSTEQPSTEQPSTEQPNAVQPSTEQPSTEQPSTEQPNAVQPDNAQPKIGLFIALFLVGLGNFPNVFKLLLSVSNSIFYGAIAAMCICFGSFAIAMYENNNNRHHNNYPTTAIFVVVLVVDFLATALHVYNNIQSKIIIATFEVFGVGKVVTCLFIGSLFPIFSLLLSLVIANSNSKKNNL